MPPLRSWSIAFTSAALVVAWTRASAAAEYYAAPSGSGDGSLGSPFSLFQAANTAQAGDTVYLRGGVYTGTLRPTNSGTSSAWITFAAYPGELPIFDGGGSGGTGVGSSTAQYIRFIGIVARNFSSTGFGNGWTNGSCSPLSNGNLQFINVIADGNGINGIAFYCASGVLIEQSIVAHNGNQQPSWSSGVNLFSARGTASDNIVRQTVSFENIDISTNRTDGSGFILDQGSTGATFENNVGFRNGGSCIRLTNSANSNLVNNTCFNNGIDTNVLYHDEIFYSDANSRVGALLRNTVAVASSGNEALWGESGVTLQNNVFVDDAGPAGYFVSTSGLLDFNLTGSASSLIDQGSGATPAVDIGFDPKCLRQASGQPVSWWQYAVDYDYVASIGGVAACFAPKARSGALDIGAYELADGSAGTTTTSTTASATTASATTASATTASATTASATTASATTASATTASATTASATTASATTASATTASATTASATTASATTASATTASATTASTTTASTTTASVSASVTTASATDGSTGSETGSGGATATSAALTGAGGSGGIGGVGDAVGTGTASGMGGASSDSMSSASSASDTLGVVSSSAALTTGGPSGGDPTCQLPLSECAGVCVDTASNPAHCGNCGVVCAASEVCASGLCTVSCAPGFTRCGQACVVTSSDNLNCGACGLTCDLGQTCQQGSCAGEPTGGDPTVPVRPDAKIYGDAGCGCSIPGAGASRFGWPLGGLCALFVLGRWRRKGALYTSGTVRRY